LITPLTLENRKNMAHSLPRPDGRLEAEAAGYPVVRPRDREARTRKENIDMAEARDKARNSAQGAKGKAKEAAGRATGNDRLRAKGKTDQAKSKVKKTGERVKDRFR